ncbi:hypothetical protein FEQ02_05880 [Burkholderia pseudomultivorans]|nr:hypothetical protein [Burkholderia pseudomultivorans]
MCDIESTSRTTPSRSRASSIISARRRIRASGVRRSCATPASITARSLSACDTCSTIWLKPCVSWRSSRGPRSRSGGTGCPRPKRATARASERSGCCSCHAANSAAITPAEKIVPSHSSIRSIERGGRSGCTGTTIQLRSDGSLTHSTGGRPGAPISTRVPGGMRSVTSSRKRLSAAGRFASSPFGTSALPGVTSRTRDGSGWSGVRATCWRTASTRNAASSTA